MKKLSILFVLFALPLMAQTWLYENDPIIIGKESMDKKVVIRQVGDNLAVGATEEDMSLISGVYTAYTDSCKRLLLVSSSGSDSVAGTGVRSVYIVGIDTSWAYKTEKLNMKGRTNVPTTSAYYRIFDMYADSVGSGANSAGNITLKDTVGTDTTYSTIPTGYLRSEQTNFTVPMDKCFYLKNFWCSATYTSNAQVTLYARPYYKSSLGAWKPIITMRLNGNVIPQEFDMPFKFTEKQDLKVMAKSASGTDTLAVWYEGWIEAE